MHTTVCLYERPTNEDSKAGDRTSVLSCCGIQRKAFWLMADFIHPDKTSFSLDRVRKTDKIFGWKSAAHCRIDR